MREDIKLLIDKSDADTIYYLIQNEKLNKYGMCIIDNKIKPIDKL